MPLPLQRFFNGDSLAQQVEHNTFNVGVVGSSPTRITKTQRGSHYVIPSFPFHYLTAIC